MTGQEQTAPMSSHESCGCMTHAEGTQCPYEHPERYTLDEARQKLAEKKCSHHGHSWDVMDGLDGIPRIIFSVTARNRIGQRRPEEKSS